MMVMEDIMPYLHSQDEATYQAGFKAGQQEVVEWIHTWHRDVEDMIEWQDQLKDWGIGPTP